ncbi:MAG: AI-2E family transporter, partial [Deltaproteobacteria bacterium]|nr:AI-2E family transporter [Deltaproteobacteria bacterium]
RAGPPVSPILEERFGVTLRMDPAAIASALEAHASELAAPSGWLIEHLFQSVVSIVLAAVNTVIVIVLTYYLVESHDAIGAKALAVIPPRWRDNVLAVARAVDHALSAFILGQVTVCVLMAALYAVALSLIGVEGGAIIGILTGLANFVPYLGLATGLSLSLLSVGLNYAGPGQIVAVLGVFAALPLLDSTLITPKVVGDRTGLNPFVVIVALLVGADLAGPLGLLLALPTAAVLRALLRLWLESYRKSRFFLGDGAESSPGSEAAAAPPAEREQPPTA